MTPTEAGVREYCANTREITASAILIGINVMPRRGIG